MPKTETVEALLSPSLRVSRPVAACSRCRGAKIKCDGKLPSCTACEKAGKASSCSGANDDFAKGKERSYVAALEGACERLQKRIDELKATRNSDMLSEGLATQNIVSKQAQRVGRARRKEASDVDDLVGDFGFLSVNATSRDFHGFTGTMSWSRLLLTLASRKPLPNFDSRQLPPRYYATQLIQQYLDNIYVFMPFISETDLMISLAAVYRDPGRQLRALDVWTVRMVLAIAIASMSRSKDDSLQRQALNQVSAALEVAEDVLHPGSIAGLQAILLLTQYSLIDAQHFSCWHLIGIASRVLVDLGLHQEPAYEIKVSNDALDTRRRVFHSLYCMDRHISMAYSRAFSFTDDSAAVELPSTQSLTGGGDGSQPTMLSHHDIFLHSIQPFLFLLEIRRIQSCAYQILCESSRHAVSESSSTDAYVWSVFSNAQNWYGSIPATVSQQHARFFRLELLYTQLFILSPSIRIPEISDLNKGLIFEYSIEFAEKMQPMIQEVGLHPFLSSTDIRRMNNIGKVFLNVLWSAYDEILAGKISSQHSNHSDPAATPQPPPYRPSQDVLKNTDRALRFFNITIEILEYGRQRWNLGQFRDNFEQQSAVLMGKLRLKQSQLRKPQDGHNLHSPNAPITNQVQGQQMQQPSHQTSPNYQQSQQWPDHGFQQQTGHQGQQVSGFYQHMIPGQALPSTQLPQSQQYFTYSEPGGRPQMFPYQPQAPSQHNPR